MSLFCSKLSESFLSHSARKQNSSKWTTKPHTIPTLLLSPSTPAILGHSQILKPAQISQPLPFLLSAWAPLPPHFYLKHPFIPCMALFKCHLLCEAFSGCNIYNYSLHTQNFLSLPSFIFPPPLFFFNALLLHKQSIFHQEVVESFPKKKVESFPKRATLSPLVLCFLFTETTQSYEAWLFQHFPGNRALTQSNGLKLKILIRLNGAHFPTPSLKEKNLTCCCQDTTFCNSETNARSMLSFFSLFSPVIFL